MQVILSDGNGATEGGRASHDVRPTYGNSLAAKVATEADMAHMADLGWMREMQTSAVMDLLSAQVVTTRLTEDAFDVLCSGASDRLVLRRDVTDACRARSVQTLAWAGTGKDALYGLVDLTLETGSGRPSLRTQDAGIYWARHAVARRYERTVEPGSMGLAMARELAPHRTVLRLVVREAARLDMPLVPVPLDRGMLFGTLRTYDWVPVCGSVRVEVEEGRPMARAEAGSCVAADGNRWTGVTYVTENYLRPEQTHYGALWRELSDDRAVATLAEVMDRNDLGPDDVEDRAAAETSLRDRIRTLLLMAVRGYGRDQPGGN